jgi:mRNA interferase HicA
MTGNELLRRLRRIGSRRGVAVRFEEERGKGSHGTLYFGDRFTVLKGPPRRHQNRFAPRDAAPTRAQ